MRVSLQRPRFFFCQNSTSLFVLLFSVDRMMDSRMAEWVQGNDRVNVVGSIIRPSIDMVTFEIRLPAFGLEWRRRVAALANAFCPAENVSCHGSRAIINVSFPTGASAIVPSFNRSLLKDIITQGVELFDTLLKGFLRQGLATHEIENDLRYSSAFGPDLDFTMAIVEPFAIEPIFSVLFDEEENGPAVLYVVSDLVVIVVPGITVLRALAIIFVAAVGQKSIVIAVVIALRVRHHDHSVFSIVAVADPHHLVPAKRDANVCASMEDPTNVFMPRHVLPPEYLPLAVSTAASCGCVKEKH